MHFRKITGTVAVAAVAMTVVLSGAWVASAAEGSTVVSTEVEASATMESLVTRADPYVNVQDGKFVLYETGAAAVLNPDEIQTAQTLIRSSNAKVDASVDAGATFAVTGSAPRLYSTSTSTLAPSAAAATLAFKQGVTKVEAHWYGFRVWLSRDTVRAIGGGIGIAGVWIPEPVVSKVFATIGGVTAAFAPGGIVFNYTPVPVPGFPAGAVWGFEWQ